MSEENLKINDELLLAEKLVGKKVRVINPKDGADIHSVKHYAGHDFVLKAGNHIDVDEAIAKSACYLWQFLELKELPKDEVITVTEKEKEKETDLVNDINSVDADFEYPNKFQDTDKFLLDKYAFHIKQKIAQALGIKGSIFMKKENLQKNILEHSLLDLSNACEKLQIPFYII